MFTSILACLLSITSLFAQKDKSLLWKIEGNGIETSYIFGTFHIIPKGDFLMKEKVKKAFAETEVTVLELDMDDPGMAAEMQGHLMLKDGKKLSDFMDDEEYKILDTFLKEKMGVGMAAFGSMKPMAISSMVTIAMMGEQTESYEGSLIAMSKEQEKEVLGLETVAFQMGVFDGQSYEEQIDQAVAYLKDQDKTNAQFDLMIDMYKKEDIKAMHKSFSETFEMEANMQKALLDDRNKNWIPKIKEISSKQKAFYGVGAGHLGGKNGVLKLLKKAGYKVTPVMD